ncbi:hypothetical protein HY478_03145 [Candidatus Uhrbacteria bacterium]|nr:hypothetical protein [Candidatus Uhrbacteria bacterium]
MTLSPREIKLLNVVIREYTRTALPVGSGRLAEMLGNRFSPATIRLDLADLEAEGYLTHPHTSAGRIPTSEGYRFYIDHLPSGEAWEPARRLTLEARSLQSDLEALARWAVKMLAEETGETAFAGVGLDQVFYTGLTNLFSKPEFQEHARIVRLSSILDHLDEMMHSIALGVPRDIRIYVGSENPFGAQCGSILMKVCLTPGVESLLGIIGPMRMDYERNMAIMRGMRLFFREPTR